MLRYLTYSEIYSSHIRYTNMQYATRAVDCNRPEHMISQLYKDLSQWPLIKSKRELDSATVI